MPSIGPDLPPHLLAKRKRKLEAESTSASVSNSSERKSPEVGEKRRRVAGPAPPPAPLDELPPSKKDEDDSSSSDDEFGPALPTGDDPVIDDDAALSAQASLPSQPVEQKLKRDEWMMIPPKQDDLAARMDPTKIRARKFNSGKGARAPTDSSASNSLWTETAEQKQKRLQNEVLGITEPGASGDSEASRRSKVRAQETSRRLKEHSDQNRGESLYAQHKERNTVEEDDPSKRAFDREKDMGAGLKLGHTQRKQMMDRAANFGSKFSGGGYL